MLVASVVIAATLAEYDQYHDSTDLGTEEHKLKVYYGRPKYQRNTRSANYEDEAATDLSLDDTKLNSWRKFGHLKYAPNYYYSYHPAKYYGYRGRRSTDEEPIVELSEYEQDDDMGADEHKLRKYFGRRYYTKYRGYYPRYYKGHYRYRPYYG